MRAAADASGVGKLTATNLMNSTRKLPVSYNPRTGKMGRREFLVPHLSGNGELGFIGIKSGRRFQSGALNYVGKDVTPEMLLERYCEKQPMPSDRTEAVRRLTAFVEALQAFKIGNVLSVSYTTDSLPVLRLESEFTRFPDAAPMP